MSELFAALQRRALYWLAQREQSEAELRRKLRGAAASLLRTSSQQASALNANKGGDGGLDGGGSEVADEPDASTWSDEAMLSEQSALVPCQGSNAACSLALKPDGVVASRRHSPSYDSASRLASGLDSGAIKRHLSPDTTPASELIDQLIDWLRERQYLSDQRFIDSRLRVRQSRFGAQRIANELAQHGLSLSEEDRRHLAETELSRAHAVWARKFGATPPVEPAARASQTRFLAQRGFSGAVIRRVLRGEGAEENTP
jgi:regulatory protein